jgi:hypothetical protein
VAAATLLLKVGRTTISPIIISVSKVGNLMVHSFAARLRAAGWSTKAWSQGIPHRVHVGNLKSLGPKVCPVRAKSRHGTDGIRFLINRQLCARVWHLGHVVPGLIRVVWQL